MSFTLQTDIEIEEGVELNCNIVYDVIEGEPLVMHYPDGSGHPGSPPSLEFESVDVIGALIYVGEFAGEWTHYDIEVRGCKAALNGMAERHIESQLGGTGSSLEEEMFEYAGSIVGEGREYEPDEDY